MLEGTGNVIPFKARSSARPFGHPNGLIEAVYSAGSLAVGTDDIATKTAAMMLQGLGLVVIEEVLADGTLHEVKRGHARQAMDRPWRLAKPPFSGKSGVPDADGAFRHPV